MLSVIKCYEPQRGSMADFIGMSREAIRQNELQERDSVIRPYDIWARGEGKVFRMPGCLTAMDRLVDERAASDDKASAAINEDITVGTATAG